MPQGCTTYSVGVGYRLVDGRGGGGGGGGIGWEVGGGGIGWLMGGGGGDIGWEGGGGGGGIGWEGGGGGGIGWLMGGGQVVGHADLALARCRSSAYRIIMCLSAANLEDLAQTINIGTFK